VSYLKKPKKTHSPQLPGGLKQGKDDVSTYAAKRSLLSREPENPKAARVQGGSQVFVVQQHESRRPHFDLRLEKDGVLKSWAVPKGLPESSGERRLAVETENHPLAYANFQGTIPEGQYGAGQVTIWDKGTLKVNSWENDKIEFTLDGAKAKGKYALVREL
jgi:bifunctional non-homologous end joining protein LigD